MAPDPVRVASGVQYTTPGRRVDTSGYTPAESLVAGRNDGPAGQVVRYNQATGQYARVPQAVRAAAGRSGLRLDMSPKVAPAKKQAKTAQNHSKTDLKSGMKKQAKAKPSRAKIAKPEKVPRTKAVSSPKAREDKNKVCGRPDDNRPKGGGGGSMRKFIPWGAKPC